MNKNGTDEPKNISQKKRDYLEAMLEPKRVPAQGDLRSTLPFFAPPESTIDDSEIKTNNPMQHWCLTTDSHKGGEGSTKSGNGRNYVWYCCSCMCSGNAYEVSGPYSTELYEACITCSHEKCPKCRVEHHTPQDE